MRKFTEAIHDATRHWLEKDGFFQVFGLGADYPNGLDGTMGTLAEEYFGRVHDVPASESAVTGMALGRAISGKRTLVHHGRAEFAMFAADQILTQSAKWRYQFGGIPDVWLTLRIALGRQWGNGPQHTASYIQAFTSVPGLRTVIASSPNSAESLLKLSVATPDPVIFLEPRWLYKISQDEPAVSHGYNWEEYEQQVRVGEDLAIVSYGEGILDSVRASERFPDCGISIYDFWNLTPGSSKSLGVKLARYKRILFVDPYCSSGGPLLELATNLSARGSNDIQIQFLRVPNVPVPTPPSMTARYYLDFVKIGKAVSSILKHDFSEPELTFNDYHLPPTTCIGERWQIHE